jgi:ribose transport system substrate-binding protein
MNRRNLLKVAGTGLGAACLSNGLISRAAAAAETRSSACYQPWTASTEMFKWKQKAPPYRIAFANSFVGNDARTEMVKISKAYAARPEMKTLLKDFSASSSGNDVSAQIAQFNQLILRGVDAIVTDAASPTGINSVISDAADAGVLVISFDNVVTSDRAVLVNHDQVEMGRIWARFIAKQTGGNGKILMVRGVAGTSGDQDFYNGGMDIFSKYPGLKLVEVNGNWDQGTAQKVTGDVLATGAKFDGVWSEYGDTGVVRAFLQGPGKVPPIAGQAENGFRKLAAQHQFPMMSAGVALGLVAMSMKTAVDLLQGMSVPRKIRVDLEQVTTADLKPGVNYYPDLSDSFVDSFNIPACDLEFTTAEILAQSS